MLKRSARAHVCACERACAFVHVYLRVFVVEVFGGWKWLVLVSGNVGWLVVGRILIAMWWWWGEGGVGTAKLVGNPILLQKHRTKTPPLKPPQTTAGSARLPHSLARHARAVLLSVVVAHTVGGRISENIYSRIATNKKLPHWCVQATMPLPTYQPLPCIATNKKSGRLVRL